LSTASGQRRAIGFGEGRACGGELARHTEHDRVGVLSRAGSRHVPGYREQVSTRWDHAVEELRHAVDHGGSLCRPFLRAFPISGAAISTIGGPLAATTICASDPVAHRLDELQLDLGEGPCWDAVRQNRIVSAPDLSLPGPRRWPAFEDGIREHAVASVFALPLRIGQVKVGAVDLYSDRPHPLEESDLRDAQSLAGMAVREVFRRAVEAAGSNTADDEDDGMSRTIVHQATGMIIAQLDIAPGDATLVLKGRAFSTGRSVRDVARDVVDRKLDFSQQDGQTS
jgi:GAF domain-containing protein